MECVKWKNKDYESAVYYLKNWLMTSCLIGIVNKGEEVLTDFYIDGISYSPRFDGEKWSLGEDFIELFKLIKCGENDE